MVSKSGEKSSPNNVQLLFPDSVLSPKERGGMALSSPGPVSRAYISMIRIFGIRQGEIKSEAMLSKVDVLCSWHAESNHIELTVPPSAESEKFNVGR